MNPDYAIVCGMTKDEIERNFQPELAALAAMKLAWSYQTKNNTNDQHVDGAFSAKEGVTNYMPAKTGDVGLFFPGVWLVIFI